MDLLFQDKFDKTNKLSHKNLGYAKTLLHFWTSVAKAYYYEVPMFSNRLLFVTETNLEAASDWTLR